MTPLQKQQKQLVCRHPQSSIHTQKVQLIYKLFLLENARKTLQKDLDTFISKAYEDIQCFLNSSLPTSVFGDLANGLDAKCHTIDKLSALLKEFVAEPQVCVQPAVKLGMRTNQLKPLGDKRVLITDVLKFGPMLQNVLMASSIMKSVQVLGGTLSLQQLKHFLISQPAAAQEDDMINCISSSYNSAVQTKSSSCYLKVKENEQAVIYKEKNQQDDVILQPAMNQSPKINPERTPPPLLLPPIEPIFPKLSNQKPKKVTPLISWRREDNFQVQHQKQTSSQLLHFLRAKAKNMGALEVTVMEWNKSTHPSGLPQPRSSSIKTQSYQFRNVVSDDLIESQARKTLCANMEDQGPVFRVKRGRSNGSLTYTCVIATKTELWDFGDILTEVQKAHSDSPAKMEGCQNIAAQVENSCVNIQWKTQTESERQSNNVDAKTPKSSSVTIPEFRVRRFEEIEVVASHIVSPGNFYIQHADSFTRLQALVTDSWKASRSYAEQNCIPDIGTQVMGWFSKQEQWCRAQVTKICGVIGDDDSSDDPGSETMIKVEVKRVDHGDTACLSLLCIKELTPEMAVLPLQAVQVSLANVTPVNGRDWSEESVAWFKAMVHDRTLYARLYPQALKVTVELFLEKGKIGAMRRGASLSLRLAQNGHAKHSELKKNALSKSTVKLKMKKQDSDWDKYLISCYTQNKREQ